MQRGGRRLPALALIVAAVTVLWAATLGTAIPALASAGASTSSPQPASGPTNPAAASQPQPGSSSTKQAGDPISQKVAATQGSPSPSVEAACPEPKIPHHMRCLAERRTDVARPKGAMAAATPQGYGPGDLHDAYKLPQGLGAGSLVAIVDAYDDPNAEADLNAYRAQYGLGACTTANGCFQKVDERGGTTYPAPDLGWAEEISLDLDMVSAICPLCHILLVEGDAPSFDDLGKAVNEAVALGARFVSNSYGAIYDQSDITPYNAYYHHPGTVITASSGDSGYGVQFPASVPDVVSVGGTSLNRDSSAPRGWSESVWSGAGSGCSTFQSKPAWQTDAGCTHRTVADVSAVADPNTGVAVYDSYGLSTPGWHVFGGTSVSAPIMASVYALVGIPPAGSSPASWPYGKAGALFDVTTGSNGTCTPAYLCTAGAGYDGPTGLGTPNGTPAFGNGPYGAVAGTVTDASTGKPLALAEVHFGQPLNYTVLTDEQGHYRVTLPVANYPVTVTAFGYGEQSTTMLVSDGQTTTMDFRLQPVPFHTVSGRVTDGAGHGWPLYAQLSVPGTPVATVSDATTGRYSLSLPVNHSWPLEVKSSYYPGYRTAKATIAAGTGDIHQDLGLPIDMNVGNSAIENYIPTGCTSPGYKFAYSGSTQAFNPTSMPAGWTVDDKAGNGNVWKLDNAQVVRNYTTDPVGTTDPYVGVNLFGLRTGPKSPNGDTSLISPLLDLTNDPSPVVEWDNHFPNLYVGGGDHNEAFVDVSTDRGATWTTVFDLPDNYFWETAHAVVQIPQAAGKKQVQVRFRYYFTLQYFVFAGNVPDLFAGWQVDNVFIGNKSCELSHGGLVVGHVTDQNTGARVNQAQVAVAGTAVTTAPAPAGSKLGDGAYYAFVPAGPQRVTASQGNYHPETRNVDVDDNTVTQANLALTAARLQTGPGAISVTAAAGQKQTATITVKNTGSRPATFSIEAQPGSGTTTAAASTPPPDAGPPPATIWQKLTSLHRWVSQSVAATDPDTGFVYSIGGFAIMPGSTGFTLTRGLDSVYDPKTDTWHAIRQLVETYPGAQLDKLNAGFVDGRLYVVAFGNNESWLLSYNPRTDTWSRGENMPLPRFRGASAVMNGKLYIIGGQTLDYDDPIKGDVQVYDPKTNHWSLAASYPASPDGIGTGIESEACGAIDGKLYCAGGTRLGGLPGQEGYVYDPQANSWSSIASLPIALDYMAYAAANGKLLVAGGDGNSGQTNKGFAYDRRTNAWIALPDNDQIGDAAAGACGFYRIGGSKVVGYDKRGLWFGYGASNTVERLPGYTNCNGNAQVSWLSVGSGDADYDARGNAQKFLTLGAGEEKEIKVTLDATTVKQPGVLNTNLVIHQNTPYDFGYIPVTLTVQ